MDLDETWQVGLRPEKTKSWTFPAKSRNGFRSERARENGSQTRCFFVTCTTHHFTSITFLRSISAKCSMNTCPRAGSRHVVSNSRKVSSKGSNFPKNPLIRVQKGTLFVMRLGVTGNVLRRLDCFHPVVDIPQINLSWVTFA